MSKQIVVGQIYYNKADAILTAIGSAGIRKVRVLKVDTFDHDNFGDYANVVGEFIGSEHLGSFSWYYHDFQGSYAPVVSPGKIWKELNDIHDS